jgi:hypothetical protein
MNVVGVTSGLNLGALPPKLKMHSLLFDRFLIAFTNEEKVKRELGSDIDTVNEILYLYEENLVSEGRRIKGDPSRYTPAQRLAAAEREAHFELSGELLEIMGQLQKKCEESTRDIENARSRGEVPAELIERNRRYSENLAAVTVDAMGIVNDAPPRLIAIDHRAFGNANAMFIGGLGYSLEDNNVDRPADAASLYTIMIDGLPFPDQLVSWQDILQFKADKNVQERLHALRAWTNEMARSGLSRAEAFDKISHLKESYKREVRAAGFKFGTGVVKALVVGVPALLVGKFDEALKAGIEVFEAKAALSDAERSALGFELSYLVQAERAFGTR